MDTIPIVFKRISPNDTIFFVFEISKSKFVLYDSGLGDPIKYGSKKLILGEIEIEIKKAKDKKRKQFKVYWLIRDDVKGWKESPQRPKGYSYDGMVNELQSPAKNSTNIENPSSRKKIYLTEKQFYWFEFNAAKHVVYDSDMGSPVSYGDFGFVNKTFNKMDKSVRDGKQLKYILWYFKRNNDDDLWKQKQPPRIPNWKVESTDKKDLNDEKKKEI